MNNKLKILAQIVGVALVAFAGHGLVRLLIDHSDYGLMGWFSNDFYTLGITHIVLILAGMVMAARAVKSPERRR